MGTDNKRQRLVDAAYSLFTRKGFHNASIKEIANEAGITSGLVHYYFKNKEELLFAVQSDCQKRYHSQYDGGRGTALIPQRVLQEIQSRAENDSDWYRWRYELFSLGLKGEPFKQEVSAILQDGRDSLSGPLKNMLANPEEAEPLARILLACFDGLALQKLMDDDTNLDETYALLFRLIGNQLENKGGK